MKKTITWVKKQNNISYEVYLYIIGFGFGVIWEKQQIFLKNLGMYPYSLCVVVSRVI
jgi:hypothetical protein